LVPENREQVCSRLVASGINHFSQPCHYTAPRDIDAADAHSKFLCDRRNRLFLDSREPKRPPGSVSHFLSNLLGRPAEQLAAVLDVELAFAHRLKWVLIKLADDLAITAATLPRLGAG